MHITHLSGLLVALLLLGAAPSRATTLGPWHEVQLDRGSFAVSYGAKTYLLNVSAAPDIYLDDHAWIDVLAPKQSIGKIQKAVEQQYGLLSGDLTLVGSCERRGTNCTPGEQMGTGAGKKWIGSSTSTFSSNSPFDYLAVRAGLSELLFHWSAPTSSFTLAGIPSSLVTDYRAFIGPPVLATPLPAAGVLLASGLLGILGLGRRRRTAANAG